MESTNQQTPLVVYRDPTISEIANFLATRTGDQMLQLMQSLQEPRAQVALTKAMLLIPPPAPPVAATPDVNHGKAKKALNAFVGFRCYYILIPAFKPWPMKKLSNPMGIMWESDPNKSLWSLMAKAWSTIRDQIGKDNAPLDWFFRIMCPYLNIPSPEAYLEYQGWKLGVDSDGAPTLSREATPQSALNTGVADAALSVEDIINYCQSMGYAAQYVSGSDNASSTFLGKSASVHEGRVTKRRPKRKGAIMPPELREQIAQAHLLSETLPPVNDSMRPGNTDDMAGQFHNNVSNLMLASAEETSALANHLMAPNPFTGLPSVTDWAPFRNGADENATLPSFSMNGF